MTSDEQVHASIDRVSNGPRKIVIAIIGLLITIASILIGLLIQSFSVGAYIGRTEATIVDNRKDIDAANLQLQGVITSLQSIVTLDSLQNYQIRANQRKLDEVLGELRLHRRKSE
jgi:capsular polysaccharide biosynthesis protein